MDDERRRKLCVEWNYLINFFSDWNDVNCLLAYFAKKHIFAETSANEYYLRTLGS